MEYICGFTFAPFCGAGILSSASAKESLKQMQERTGADFVIFAPNGVQKNAHSEEICYTSEATMTDEELVEMITYAKDVGRILRTFKIKKNVEVTDNGKIII